MPTVSRSRGSGLFSQDDDDDDQPTRVRLTRRLTPEPAPAALPRLNPFDPEEQPPPSRPSGPTSKDLFAPDDPDDDLITRVGSTTRRSVVQEAPPVDDDEPPLDPTIDEVMVQGAFTGRPAPERGAAPKEPTPVLEDEQEVGIRRPMPPTTVMIRMATALGATTVVTYVLLLVIWFPLMSPLLRGQVEQRLSERAVPPPPEPTIVRVPTPVPVPVEVPVPMVAPEDETPPDPEPVVSSAPRPSPRVRPVAAVVPTPRARPAPVERPRPQPAERPEPAAASTATTDGEPTSTDPPADPDEGAEIDKTAEVAPAPVPPAEPKPVTPPEADALDGPLTGSIGGRGVTIYLDFLPRGRLVAAVTHDDGTATDAKGTYSMQGDEAVFAMVETTGTERLTYSGTVNAEGAVGRAGFGTRNKRLRLKR